MMLDNICKGFNPGLRGRITRRLEVKNLVVLCRLIESYPVAGLGWKAQLFSSLVEKDVRETIWPTNLVALCL
jgi:hypothetical protein